MLGRKKAQCMYGERGRGKVVREAAGREGRSGGGRYGGGRGRAHGRRGWQEALLQVAWSGGR